MGVLVRILGPLEIVHAGRRVDIRGGKERALVVRLALDAGRVVSADKLVETLWGDDPPESAATSVRVLVSRVRKALSAAGADDVITTRAPGYVLVADEVDAARFDFLAAQGRAALAEGRPDEAAATLADAVALWRGEQLAETSNEQLRADGTRLDEARMTALESRIEADLACGRHGDVVAELDALCRAHPLREGLWALRITALYRCERQADSLAAYQELRRTLADELGIDPSDRLRRLEAAVLAQDPSLTAPDRLRHQRKVPLPTALEVAERAPLVGRDDELQLAHGAWGSAVANLSAVVLVSGQAGAGKSRLVRELAREVHESEAVVLYGRCDEDLAIPYRPFVECLSHLVAHTSEDVLARVGLQPLAELARLVPGVAARRPALPVPSPAEAHVERYRLFEAVGSMLATLAQETPVLVCVEDLHWADRPTLQLLRHLAGLNIAGVALVATYRSAAKDDDPLVEALGALPRDARVTRIALHGLSESHTGELIRGSTGDASDEQLTESLHRQTDGNPFYLVEMLSHLRETGALDTPDAATVDVGAVGLPESIRDVLRARVARLGQRAARLLAEAAVIGQEFDVDVLARVADLTVDTALDALDGAARAALVDEPGRPPGRFRFVHALVQQTLYLDVGATRRTRAHARVAAAMEALGGRQPGELAFHSLAGITVETTAKAVLLARAAGATALAASAPDEAVRWYTAALNALPPPRDDGDHARALVDLGVAQRQAGHPAYRETLLAAADLARRNKADDLLVEAALESTRGGFSRLGEVDAERVAVLEAALLVVPPDSAQRARLLAVLAGELTWDPDHTRRIALVNEAVDIARRMGDPATLLYTILRPGVALAVPETGEQRVALLREAMEIAERIDNRLARGDATLLLAPMLTEVVSSDRLNDAVDDAVQVAAELGEPWDHMISVIVRACLALTCGDLERAEGGAEEMIRIGRESGQPDTQLMYDELLYVIRWHQGRLDEILPGLRRAAAAFGDLPAYTAGFACGEALAGDPERARTLLGAAADHGFDVFYGAAWLGRMCQWANVAAEIGETAAAAVLYDKLVSWGHLFALSGPMPVHAVALSLARLAALRGDVDRADRHFADAMRVHETLQFPFGIAATALHWGELLRSRDAARAKALFTTATEVADRYGFGDIARRAREALRTY